MGRLFYDVTPRASGRVPVFKVGDAVRCINASHLNTEDMPEEFEPWRQYYIIACMPGFLSLGGTYIVKRSAINDSRLFSDVRGINEKGEVCQDWFSNDRFELVGG